MTIDICPSPSGKNVCQGLKMSGRPLKGSLSGTPEIILPITVSAGVCQDYEFFAHSISTDKQLNLTPGRA